MTGPELTEAQMATLTEEQRKGIKAFTVGEFLRQDPPPASTRLTTQEYVAMRLFQTFVKTTPLMQRERLGALADLCVELAAKLLKEPKSEPEG